MTYILIWIIINLNYQYNIFLHVVVIVIMPAKSYIIALFNKKGFYSDQYNCSSTKFIQNCATITGKLKIMSLKTIGFNLR